MVSYNRRPVDTIGSLSPCFIKKLNTKPKPLIVKEPSEDEGLKRQPTSIGESPKKIDPPLKRETPDLPVFMEQASEPLVRDPCLEEISVSQLLADIPLEDRYNLTEAEQMEFMSYLRPVL